MGPWSSCPLCLFGRPCPADEEQHCHSFGVMFLTTIVDDYIHIPCSSGSVSTDSCGKYPAHTYTFLTKLDSFSLKTRQIATLGHWPYALCIYVYTLIPSVRQCVGQRVMDIVTSLFTRNIKFGNKAKVHWFHRLSGKSKYLKAQG